MKMSETNGNGTMAEHIADGNIEPVMKKARIDESVEERDFDEETQKALEEIDANQNEIDALNEREFCLKLLQNKRGLGISHTRYKVLFARICASVRARVQIQSCKSQFGEYAIFYTYAPARIRFVHETFFTSKSVIFDK